MGGRASSQSRGTMPLYLKKSAFRRVGEWFLAVRAIASSWMVTVGVMAFGRAVLSYILYRVGCFWTGKKSSNKHYPLIILNT